MHHLPETCLGNARTLTVIRYGAQTADYKAYIQAGLHADEAPGFIVMHHLINRLDRADLANQITGQILLVPVANPIGISQWRDDTLFGRREFNNGVNFNRQHMDLTEQVAEKIKDRLGNQSDKNVAVIRGAMAEALLAVKPKDEAEYLKHLLLSLSCDADIVLDLHCDTRASLHVYTGTPLWPDAADLSAQMGAEVTLLSKKSGENPFDEACSRIWWELAEKFPAFPIPPACLAATVELRGVREVTHEYAEQDADNIFLFLQRRGLIRGKAPELPPLPSEATPLKGVEYITAQVPGVVVFIKNPGDRIDKGDVIAEIINPLGVEGGAGMEDRITTVRSGTQGILLSIHADHYAKPGRILAKVAGKAPLIDKGKHLLTP